MARTRAQIKTLVISHTGKSDKDTLESSLCDSALKHACLKHTFEDSRSTPTDVTITEDANSCALPSGTREIITVRIVNTVTDASALLTLKPQPWWDKFIITPEDNMKGWPIYGLRFGTNLILDRPAEANLSARFRVSIIPTFASDSTECPIDILDLFVEYYVTAHVFLSLEDKENFIFWLNQAKGAFRDAVNADTRDPALNYDIESPMANRVQPGVSTVIGSGFEGDFSNLSGAQWF